MSINARNAYLNLPQPEALRQQDMKSGSENTGLLSRGVKKQPKKKKQDDPRQRVANYTYEIMKARMELKNG
jgi:hypothetical protein